MERYDLSSYKGPPRSLDNCTVVSIDSANNLMEVRQPGPEGQIILVALQGTSTVAVNDIVRVWVSPEYDVGWLAGESPGDSKVSSLYTPDLTTQSLTASANSDITAIGDYFSGNDDGNAGLVQRSNIWRTPVTHFANFSGFTWATYTGFGVPSNVDTSTYPSIVNIYNLASTLEGFAYHSTFGDQVWARITTGFDVRSGIRMDDGTNNNYVQLFLEENLGLVKLRYEYAVGGSVTGPTDIFTSLPPGTFYILRLARNGDSVFLHLGNNSPQTIHTGVTPAITGWTPSRAGIYHRLISGTASNAGRSTLVDYFGIAASF